MRKLFALVALCFATPAIAAPDIVTKVTDGDSFRIQAEWRKLPISIRVFGIDAPEHDNLAQCPAEKQRGLEALAFAAALLKEANNRVYLTLIGWDKYGGRVLARVHLRIGGKRVSYNERMIAAGYARLYAGQAKGHYWCDRLQEGLIP